MICPHCLRFIEEYLMLDCNVCTDCAEELQYIDNEEQQKGE